MPNPPSPLGSVTLITGPEEFLNERVVTAARAAVLTVDAEAESRAVLGEQMTPAALGELPAPSLFSSTRLVVVRQLEDVPDDAQAVLLYYAVAPEPDIALVLVHSGGPKGSGL